jgi:hypothetical protein
VGIANCGLTCLNADAWPRISSEDAFAAVPDCGDSAQRVGVGTPARIASRDTL